MEELEKEEEERLEKERLEEEEAEEEWATWPNADLAILQAPRPQGPKAPRLWDTRGQRNVGGDGIWRRRCAGHCCWLWIIDSYWYFHRLNMLNIVPIVSSLQVLVFIFSVCMILVDNLAKSLWTLPAVQGSGGPISLLWQGAKPTFQLLWTLTSLFYSFLALAVLAYRISRWTARYRKVWLQALPVVVHTGGSVMFPQWQDGNGYIDRTEIAEVMRAMGESLDDETWRRSWSVLRL